MTSLTPYTMESRPNVGVKKPPDSSNFDELTSQDPSINSGVVAGSASSNDCNYYCCVEDEYISNLTCGGLAPPPTCVIGCRTIFTVVNLLLLKMMSEFFCQRKLFVNAIYK